MALRHLPPTSISGLFFQPVTAVFHHPTEFFCVRSEICSLATGTGYNLVILRSPSPVCSLFSGFVSPSLDALLGACQCYVWTGTELSCCYVSTWTQGFDQNWDHVVTHNLNFEESQLELICGNKNGLEALSLTHTNLHTHTLSLSRSLPFSVESQRMQLFLSRSAGRFWKFCSGEEMRPNGVLGM